MKRSLLTVIILALCVLNFILSAVIVFVLVPTTMKTDKLISKVCAVLDLELEAEQAGDKGKVSMDSITSYNIENGQTITLQSSDGKSHYVVVEVSLSLNSASKDYESVSANLATNESLIQDKINSAFSSYTFEDAKANQNKIKEDLLKELQEMYNTDCILQVAFRKIVFQ
ncbi:MAG: flagellar basal body-associated FliL family protein [Lachnospiraceae bacterium]|nr:flagellar basal body-associated FliL family protein [Lachnospiraceae bacterium]MEE1342110.1 flagellar basal body-associated FliL family protein [Lachnospiraceae bacterium]